jgi:hypothetical protein
VSKVGSFSHGAAVGDVVVDRNGPESQPLGGHGAIHGARHPDRGRPGVELREVDPQLDHR